MSSFITKTKYAAASIPNASAGKVNEFVDTDGVTKSKNESGVVEVYSGSAAVAAHVAAADPHTQYLTSAEGNAAYDTLGSAAVVQGNLTNHLSDTGNPHPQYVRPEDAVFVTPQVVRVKLSDAGLGEFTSISLAVASITDADPVTKPYMIEVGAGVHTANNPIVLPSGVSLKGEGINATTIKPQNAAQHLFVLGEMCEISFLNLKGISGSIGSGKAAIYCEDVGNFGQLHKLSIYDFDIGVDIYANTADATVYSEYVDINGDYSLATRVRSNGANVAYAQAENFYSYPSAGTTPVHIYATGTNSTIVLNSAGLSGADDNDGIIASNGAKCVLSDVFIKDFGGTGTGFISENTGSGPIIDLTGVSFSNNNKDVSIDNPNTTGVLNVTADKSKITVDDLAEITIVVADVNIGGITLVGEFNYSSNNYADVADIGPLISTSSTMGVFNGGELSAGSGLTLNVAALKGYITTGIVPNDLIKYFQLDAQTISVSANANNYIYINSSGVLVQNASAPDTRENILLGRVITNATDILFIEKAPLDSQHYSNKIDRVFREAIGSIYASGSLVSENGTRGLNITSGEYYYSETEFLPAGGTGIYFDAFYESSTAGVYTRVPAQTTVDNGFYDNGSGTLQAIPSSKHVKHLLLVIGGPSEKYILIYGTDVYTTLAEAQAAPLPVVPSYMNGAFARVASIIVQHANANIQDIIDERPRVGFASSSSVGGVTDHGALSGLGDDDHTQYLLTNGSRAMNGALNMGSNNITSAGTVNGVTVQTHGAARHLPNGADPLTTATPVAIGSALAIGTANSFARADHVHTLPDVGTANTYGSASQVPVLTTDAKGRITSVVNTAIAIVAAAVTDFADAVRSTVLTGLSLTTATAVDAADTVLQAIGKLQAQLNKTTILRVQSTLSNSSNVTLVKMTDLAFPVVAGRWYAFEAIIEYSSAAINTGASWSMAGSGGVAGTITATGSFQTSNTANEFRPISGIGTVIQSTAVPSASTFYIGKLYGVFTCTASGTLTPAFRSETNGQAISVYDSTFITVRDIT